MGRVNIKAIVEEVPLHFIVVKVLAADRWHVAPSQSMLNADSLHFRISTDGT